MIRVRRISGGEKTLRLKRDRHREPLASVEKLPTGYVLRIRSFARGAAATAKECLSTVPPGSRLLVDLRGNGGGELDEAKSMASLFLPHGAVIYQHRGNDGKTAMVTDSDGVFFQMKSLAFIIDRHTASAAELVVAALLGRPGTSLQGERTYGKNKVLDVRRLAHGGKVTIESAEILDPAGKTWPDGIDPAKWAKGEPAY